MALKIISPKNSFVQFDTTENLAECGNLPFNMCLPVSADDDLYFQFAIQADSEGEANLLCDLTNDQITMGITDKCAHGLLVTFADKTERYRISPTQVLYNWGHGVKDFKTVISNGGCFYIKVQTSQYGVSYDWCSNCFIRQDDTCNTSVIDYTGDDNQFGFDYCGGAAVADNMETCEPTIIGFTNVATLYIPYTALLQSKYGSVPTASVWVYDGSGDLVEMIMRVALDAFPPTAIKVDLGGVSSGIVKIS